MPEYPSGATTGIIMPMGCSVLSSYPDVQRAGLCQALTGRQLYRIPEQVVVVPAFGNDFIQGLGLCAGGLFTNSLFRGHLGYGNGAAGDHGEQAEPDGAAADGLCNCSHDYPWLPGTPRRALWWP